jgi:lactate racemase
LKGSDIPGIGSKRTAMLEVSNIRISYGAIEVVHGVSLRVDEGRIVALIGPNGAGKSSVLEAVSGLIRPTAGDIVFLGTSLIGVPPHEVASSGVGHVMEGRHLFGGLTVEDNLLLASSNDENSADGNIESVYQRWPRLRERKDQVAGTLSGGEQQMAAIGRALMRRPRLLMLDEPSWGLAPLVVRDLMKTLTQLRDEGMTILLVEQMANLALGICDYAYVMTVGRVALQGEPRELAANPQLQATYLGGAVGPESRQREATVHQALASGPKILTSQSTGYPCEPIESERRTPAAERAPIVHESEVAMLRRIDQEAHEAASGSNRREEQARISTPAKKLASAGPMDWAQRERQRRQREETFGTEGKARATRSKPSAENADHAHRPARRKEYDDDPSTLRRPSTDGWTRTKSSLRTEIRVPYETAEELGTCLSLDIPSQNLVRSFIPSEPPKLPDIASATTYAVEHPLNAAPLSEMVRPGSKVVIITENQFRAAPADLILPALLEIIRRAGGVPSIAIGNGKVPGLSAEEIEKKLGKDVVATGIPIVCNDVSEPDNYVYLGNTTRGVPLFVLKTVAEADVKVAISTTQATLWGYGGSGMIIPAVTGDETTELNHMFSLPDDCRPGNNECHMQEDKYEGAGIVGIDMGIHAIVSNRSDVTYLGAGDYVEAHKAAIKAYDKTYRFDAAEFAGAPADIVITGSSAPTNHLFFHTGWAVVNCDPICRDGGTIIQATPCPGYGDWPGFALMDLLQEYVPPSVENKAKAMRAFYRRDKELWAGCIWWKIYEVMTRKDVVVVTNQENLEMSRSAGLNTTSSLQDAFDEAIKRHGPDARVVFVPYGRYTVFDF